MAKPMTALERRVLDYLVEYVRQHTYQPSIREIGSRFDIKSTKTVSELLHSLAEKGWIERDASRSRGVRLLTLDLEADVVSVPHIDVHLREPSLDDPIETLALDRRIAGSSGSFLMTMVGDSLSGAGIRDGDMLLVEPVTVDALEDNELVAVRSGGESWAGRVRRHEMGASVTPGPVASGPIDLTAAEVRVLGRVVAVIRRLRTDAPAGRVARERTGEGAVAT